MWDSIKSNFVYVDIDKARAEKLAEEKNEIIIPNAYERKINEEAFAGQDSISIVDTNRITEIGDRAFKDCEGLVEILLPNVRVIGKEVFNGCNNLSKAVIEGEGQVDLIKESLEACELTQKIDICINNEVKVSINDTKSDDEAPLDKEIEKIEDSAGEDSAIQIENEDDLKKLMEKLKFEYGKEVKVELGSNISEICDKAFKENEVLAEINLDSIKTIGDYSFSGCRKLNYVKLSSIEIMGKGAFSGCYGLVEVQEMSKNIESIDKYTFSRCQELERIDLSGIKEICEHAFGMCSGLTEINLSSIETIKEDAFKGCNGLIISTSNEEQERMIRENLEKSEVTNFQINVL